MKGYYQLKIIYSVSETHDTTLGACSRHKNNERILCKHASFDASSLRYVPFYFGRRKTKYEV
jgi:hypothetical protein